jgi:hypothetical protein
MVEFENCWESKKCGRHPGGLEVDELGICPAYTDSIANGLNHGKNGGRICWAISGTLCDGYVQATFAKKRLTCLSCDFYQKVSLEEGSSFHLLKPGQDIKKWTSPEKQAT